MGGHRGKESNRDLPHSFKVTLLTGEEGSSHTAFGTCRFPVSFPLLEPELECFSWNSVYAVVSFQFLRCLTSMLSDTGGEKVVNVWFITGVVKLNSSLLPQSIYYYLPS